MELGELEAAAFGDGAVGDIVGEERLNDATRAGDANLVAAMTFGGRRRHELGHAALLVALGDAD